MYSLLNMFVFSIVAFSMMYIGKFILDRLAKKHYDADLIIEKEDNFAVALRRSGFYLGIGIAMAGSITASETFLNSLFEQVTNGILILIFMFIAMFISDKSIFPSVNNTIELKQGNIAIGIVEAMLYISTGLIAFSSFKGEGSFTSSLIFFFLGQLLLIVIGKTYAIFNPSIFKKILKGNVSAGLLIGSLMLSLAIILHSAISGDFVSWSQDLYTFTISALAGIFMLLIFVNKIVNKLFLPTSIISQEIEQDNFAAIFMVASLKISISIIISMVVF